MSVSRQQLKNGPNEDFDLLEELMYLNDNTDNTFSYAGADFKSPTTNLRNIKIRKFWIKKIVDSGIPLTKNFITKAKSIDNRIKVNSNIDKREISTGYSGSNEEILKIVNINKELKEINSSSEGDDSEEVADEDEEEEIYNSTVDDFLDALGLHNHFDSEDAFFTTFKIVSDKLDELIETSERFEHSEHIQNIIQQDIEKLEEELDRLENVDVLSGMDVAPPTPPTVPITPTTPPPLPPSRVFNPPVDPPPPHVSSDNFSMKERLNLGEISQEEYDESVRNSLKEFAIRREQGRIDAEMLESLNAGNITQEDYDNYYNRMNGYPDGEEPEEAEVDPPVVLPDALQEEINVQTDAQTDPQADVQLSNQPLPVLGDTAIVIPTSDFKPKYHLIPIKLMYGTSDNPQWDSSITNVVEKLQISKEETNHLIDAIINEYKFKLLLFKRKSNGDKVELNEVLNLQYSFERGMQTHSRGRKGLVELKDLVSLASPNNTNNGITQQTDVQQRLNQTQNAGKRVMFEKESQAFKPKLLFNPDRLFTRFYDDEELVKF